MEPDNAPEVLLAEVQRTIGEHHEVLKDLGPADDGARTYLVRDRGTGEVRALRLQRDSEAVAGEAAFVLRATQVVDTSGLRVCPECNIPYDGAVASCPRDGAILPLPRDPQALIGRVIAGRFRVLKKLGDGGMGEVYLAEQLTISRPVALKVLHRAWAADPDALQRKRGDVAGAVCSHHSGERTAA